jgi:hypothetical protein
VTAPHEPNGQGQITALDMARNLVAAIQRQGHYSHRDPVGSYIDRGGERAFEAARLASYLAQVSLAEDVHRIAEFLDRDIPLDHLKGPGDPP